MTELQNPEPRFYPTFPMRIDWVAWRVTPKSERATRALAYNEEIRRLMFERVQHAHPDWSAEQHAMMFFRLCYAGDGFERCAQAKIKRGDWNLEEVEIVRQTPIPLGREDGAHYAAISHPDLDEAAMLWPNPAERGTNI